MTYITKKEAIEELRLMLDERQRRSANLIAQGKITKPQAMKRIRALQRAIMLLDPETPTMAHLQQQKIIFNHKK